MSPLEEAKKAVERLHRRETDEVVNSSQYSMLTLHPLQSESRFDRREKERIYEREARLMSHVTKRLPALSLQQQ
jgi:hypothetical protein